MTYQAISDKTGLSRQRIQQLISPPAEIRQIVLTKANGLCQHCGIMVGDSGHVHHSGDDVDSYGDVPNLELLCASCHRKAHFNTMGQPPLNHIAGVRGPDALHDRIKVLADKRGITVSEWCRIAIIRAIGLLPDGKIRSHHKKEVLTTK